MAVGTLSSRQRQALARDDFALPERAPGPGSYPIPDRDHAIDALSKVEHYGTDDEIRRVRKAVARKFPDLGATVTRHGDETVIVDRHGKTGRPIRGGQSVQIRRRRNA